MSECIAVNIQDMLKAIGEEELPSLLSNFSSPFHLVLLKTTAFCDIPLLSRRR